MVEIEEMATEESESPDDKKKARHIWNDAEDLLILTQFRSMDAEKISGKNRGVIWTEISKAVIKAKLIVSDRAVRDRFNKLLSEFRKTNPKDEWRTGETTGYSDKDRLLLEICQLEKEAERRKKELDGIKTKLDDKRDRAEQKLMVAAVHLQRKRLKVDSDDGIVDDEEKPRFKNRNRFTASASDFFEAKKRLP